MSYKDAVWTYLVTGLPPGPIPSPGRASLEAMLYLDRTVDLYFVVNGTESRREFSCTAGEQDVAG